nr:MAG TPA_asm: hypothetical protein [Caudoviricetes sp.]
MHSCKGLGAGTAPLPHPEETQSPISNDRAFLMPE